MSLNGLPFKPVKTTSQKLENGQCPIGNGYVYFTSDTQKIYLGTEVNGELKALPMGGNSGIHYGNREVSEEESNEEIVQLEFTMDHIDGNQVPSVDDLILNIPDGGFYRVIRSDKGIIVGLKIAVSGTGEGTTGSSSRPNILISNAMNYFSISEPEKMKIAYKCKSSLADGINYIQTITYTIGSTVYSESVQYYFDPITGLTEDIILDINKYLKNIGINETTVITIVAIDYYGNKSVNSFANIYLLNLSLQLVSSKMERLDYDKDKDNIYRCICKPDGGGTTEFSNRRIEWNIKNENGIIQKNESIQLSEIGGNIYIEIDYSNLNHGIYYFSAQYKVDINTTNASIPPSNTIETIIGIYRPEEGIFTRPLIITDFKNSSIQQYVPYNLKYFILDGQKDDNTEIKVYFQLNNEEDYIGNVTTQLNRESSWTYSFLNVGQYVLSLIYNNEIYELGNLKVTKYEGNAPVLNFNEIDYCLTAAGRSNTETNRDKWASIGKNKTEVVFENFLWGSNNGWTKDVNGETALKISNGAKLKIKGEDFSVLSFEEQNNGTTGLLIELDFMFNNISDFSKPLIHCLSKNNSGEIISGFELTGQKSMLNTTQQKPSSSSIDGSEDSEGNISEKDASLQALTQYYNENNRIHLAYQIPAYNKSGSSSFYFITTFLNGVMSGISKMTYTNDNILNDEYVREFNDNYPTDVVFDSTYGDIYLYNFRVTRKEFTPQNIVKHYIADYESMSTRVSLWETNDLFGTTFNKIELSKVKSILNQLEVPYVLMRGGIKMNKKFNESFTYDYNNPDYRLPYTKSDFRLMSIEMYYKNSETPIYSVPIEIMDENDENKIYQSFNDLENNKIAGNLLVSRGVQVYGQGTSSMVYPVKNLRFKFVQKQDYPIVYNGLETGPKVIKSTSPRAQPVEIVCLKADYMDSSSSHNTQTANLIYDLYASMNMKTPPQKSSLYNKDLVTAIRGYPIICFFSTDNTETGYEYIGRYNFNLDKATPEPFGFEPHVEGKNILGYEVDENGELVYRNDDGEIIEPNSDSKPHNIIQCWEILNNDTKSPSKFLTEDGYSNFLINMREKWNSYFEDRYPDVLVGALKDEEWTQLNQLDLENGLFRMACWVNSTATTEANENRKLTDSEEKYYKTRDKNPNKDKVYYDNNYQEVNITLVDSSNIRFESSSLNSFVLDLEQFKIAIKADDVNNSYGTYAFTYRGQDGWWNGNKFINDLNDYGIVYSGSPNENDIVYIDYIYIYEGWRNGLYEYFEYDSAEYRLTKFYNEFENYFNKEYSLFYYILTLVLLMMDSRAKNMMLASWDQKIWYPIFYDMDTMLGLNNTGFNKFNFDVEDINNTVFNGYDSVLWNNFRDVFQEDIANFYNTMRSSGLNLTSLLERYNLKGADSWNETLTTADAIYKYQDPYSNGYWDGSSEDGIKWIESGKKNYLYAGQGRRSNHRAWWLFNRLNYFDSKNISYSLGSEKPSSDNTFSFRAYSSPEQSNTNAAEECRKAVPPSHKFKITVLNNSYQAIMVGNNIYRSQDLDREDGGLIQANTFVELGPETAKHEVESWILNSNLIADLGDLSNKYLGSWAFPTGEPTRLTKLKFGQTIRSDPNTYSKYYNALLNTLDIGNSCPLLKELNIGKCINLSKLDISKCTNLEKLDAYGSRLTSLTLPENSIIKNLYLPDSLKELQIINQPYLQNIDFDTENGKQLSTLILSDIILNTYELCYNMLTSENGGKFKLNNINWLINSVDNNLIIEDNKIVGIEVLDYILNNTDKISQLEGLLSNALTGTITIDISSNNVDEYELYSKYIKVFPNLKFIFSENTVVDKAIEIKFLKDKNEEILYFVKAQSDNSKSLAQLVYNNTILGKDLTKNPSKESTKEYSYIFSNYWINNESEEERYYYEESNIEPYSFSYVPKNNITFYPEFQEIPRTYDVTFYDINNIKISQGKDENGNDILVKKIRYGTKYEGYFSEINYYKAPEPPRKLEEHERYTFKGWTYVNYNKDDIGVQNLEFINPANLIVEGNINLYAYYTIENAKTTPSNSWYFNYTTNNAISLKEEYKEILEEEKITIPREALSVKDFKGITKVKEIYFEEGSLCNKIESEAFDNTNRSTAYNNPILTKNIQLVGIYLPNTINNIGEYAFSGLTELQYIDLNKMGIMPENLNNIGQYSFSFNYNLMLKELPQKLTSIGTRAFIGNKKITFKRLPSSLTGLNNQIFSDCHLINITEFGDNNLINTLKIAGNPFSQAGKGNISTEINFTIWGNIITDSQIFSSYLNLDSNDENLVPSTSVTWHRSEDLNEDSTLGDELISTIKGWFPADYNKFKKITILGANDSYAEE